MRRRRTRSSSAPCTFIRRSRSICPSFSTNWSRLPRSEKYVVEEFLCGGEGCQPSLRIKTTEIFGSLEAITPGMAQVVHTPHLPQGPPGSGPPVSFARSGITAAWDPKFASLLELAEACDVPVRWSCRTGVCHTCITGLIAGSVSYQPEPLERPAPGNVLVCCSQPNADVTLDL